LGEQKAEHGFLQHHRSRIYCSSRGGQRSYVVPKAWEGFIGLGGDASPPNSLDRQQHQQQGQQQEFPQLHTDSTSALSLINNNVVSGRSKHIDVNYHVAREQAKLGTVKFVYVPTSEQLADIQTKALSIVKFSGFRMNIHCPYEGAL